MTTIYLVRHAEAEGNVYRRCHGQYDSLLTPKAWKQLPHLAARFSAVHLDAIYASDLYRARHTAKAIADGRDQRVILRPALREIDMGEWEDLSWSALPRFYPEDFAVWRNRPWECTVPGGESVIGSGDRVLADLCVLAQKHTGQTLAAVSHGSAIRNILRHAMRLEPAQIADIGWCDNTSVAKLCFDAAGRVQAEYWNDASHLPEDLSTFASIGWRDNKQVPANVQLWFRPYDPQCAADRALFVDFLRGHYKNAYGMDEIPDKAERLQRAEAALALDPEAVTFGMLEDTAAAMVFLDAANTDDPAVGMVGSFSIAAEYRGCGLSGQIIGQAISVYRRLGKTWLCAGAAERNERAQGFYRKFAFEQRGEQTNARGKHYLMYRRIKVDSVQEEQAHFDLSQMQ